MNGLWLAMTFAVALDLAPYFDHTYPRASESHLAHRYDDGRIEGWFDMRRETGSHDITTFVKFATPDGTPISIERFYTRRHGVWLWLEWGPDWYRWFYHENRRGEMAVLGLWASRRTISYRIRVTMHNCPGHVWNEWLGKARLYEVAEMEPITNTLTGEVYEIDAIVIESWNGLDGEGEWGERYYYAMSEDGRYAFGLVKWEMFRRAGQDVILIGGGQQMNVIMPGESKWDVSLPATGECNESE